MSAAIAVHKRGHLDIEHAKDSGQILRVFDRTLDMQVIAFAPGHELEINQHPLLLKLVEEDVDKNAKIQDPAWQCNLHGRCYTSVGSGWAFDIFRQVVVGSTCKPWGNHLNPPNSLHIRYRLDRKIMDEYDTVDPLSASKRPMQVPLWLDTIGALCARTEWFGPKTEMMAPHFAGGGPRSHVSLEKGPPSKVAPQLWNLFRRTHPGVQAIPGAVYTHPDGRWLWITAQRPTVGMHWDFLPEAQKAQFEYHDRLSPAEVIHTPEVSLYWGRGGEEEMYACLNSGFIGYEEPPAWWYHTTWVWMLWWAFRENGIHDMADQAEYLHEELGITGFGITAHDLRPGCWDCCAASLRPSPHIGGEEGLRTFGERVKGFGGKVHVWLPYLGLGQPSADIKPEWVIRGEDGRPYETYHINSFDLYHGLHFGHPEVQAYYLDWIRRYITEFHVEGIFWDCGGTPFPADFSAAETRPFQRWPSESMTAGYAFMEKVMQTGRACSPDFFMWHEGFNADLPGTGYCSGKGEDWFLAKLNRFGKKRIVYRSGSVYDLYGAFPKVHPSQDTGIKQRPVTRDSYKQMVADPMNQWIVQFVKKHGVRQAQWLTNGVAYCAGHVVVDPDLEAREVTIPPWMAAVKTLQNVHTAETVMPSREDEAGITFCLNGAAAYAVV